jgi:hypothetical protein
MIERQAWEIAGPARGGFLIDTDFRNRAAVLETRAVTSPNLKQTGE